MGLVRVGLIVLLVSLTTTPAWAATFCFDSRSGVLKTFPTEPSCAIGQDLLCFSEASGDWAKCVGGETGAALSPLGETSGTNVQALTIVAGSITLSGSATGQGLYTVGTEAGAASDDLTAINGGSNYALITLRPATTGQYFVLRDDGTTILLIEHLDFRPQSTDDFITLRTNAGGTVWREEARGRFP